MLQLLHRAALMLSLVSPLFAAFSTDSSKPNIILFVIDDMGWQDTSVPLWTTTEGVPQKTFLNKRYKTPHMEALADKGLVFTRAYVNPLSSPTRVSFMSGMSVLRHHVTNSVSRVDHSEDGQNPILKMPQWNINGLQPSGTFYTGKTKDAITGKTLRYEMKKGFAKVTTLPHYLKKAGYITLHSGKANWGAEGSPGANPLLLGFDHNIAGRGYGEVGDYRGQMKYGKGSEQIKGFADAAKHHKKDTFLTEALTQETLSLLSKLEGQAKGAPFFLSLGHYAVSTPLDERAMDKRFIDNYPDERQPTHPEDQKHWGPDERTYSALIEGVDKSLGDIRRWLREHKLADNTIIIVISDNGGLAVSGRIPREANYPLSYGKGSLYEGGIRVPLIIHHPQHSEEARYCNAPVIAEDIFASIIDMAHAKAPTRDGRSLLSLVVGEENGYEQQLFERPLFFHLPNQWEGGTMTGIGYQPMSAVIHKQWKLIYDLERGKLYLYNLSEDIAEQHNLIDKETLVAQQLCALLSEQLNSLGTPMPSYIRNNASVPMPDKAMELLLEQQKEKDKNSP